MANEIHPFYSTGAHLYFQVISATGQFWNSGTPALEAFNVAHWGNYALTLTESGTSGLYLGNAPALPAGVYTIAVFLRAGGSPATTDGPPIASGTLHWDGSAEVGLSAVNVNLGQKGLSPRALDAVSDANLTVGDGLVAAICVAAGKRSVIGTAYTLETPFTGTAIRTFTLDSATVPTSLT